MRGGVSVCVCEGEGEDVSVCVCGGGGVIAKYRRMGEREGGEEEKRRKG